MKQILTLKLNKEFKRAYFQGKYKPHPLLVTYMVKNKGKEVRYGITTSKKIGSAVLRNRARRIIRTAFIELVQQGEIEGNGYDFVFVARTETPSSKTQQIKALMKKQILTLQKR
ncbi:ribonuclease P protein component [Paludicola sp. MB14-C6]|uniref:ribonuclease P protein component n=1 Tax=Paludihabitans sp. MB14-C6 TaxID=3070656 RepID=UPI0027DCC924|nr:ribonuclease P protein component [Paludicola sp. MB14-C6]WMJ21786.1 ribonuclease P protein component [Paludicola sp. MB14-C6]